MSEITGKLGAIYYADGYIQSDGISFHDNSPGADTIEVTGDNFIARDFEAADIISVTGTTSNDGDYTIDTVVTGVITLDSGDSLSDESAGTMFTIAEARPGTQKAGFHNWSFDDRNTPVDVTDFNDEGQMKYVPGLKDWTGRAARHWLTDDSVESWLAEKVMIRLFVDYKSTPTGSAKSYYYEGVAIVNGISTSSAVDTVVEQEITFQGTEALALKTQTTGWPA